MNYHHLTHFSGNRCGTSIHQDIFTGYKVVSPKSHLPWNRVDWPNVTIYRRLIITMETFKGSGEPWRLPNAVVFIASFLSSGKIANDFHDRLILTSWARFKFLCLRATFPATLPWVPEAFHARFQVSVKSFKMTCAKRFAVRVFGLWPKTCRHATDEAPRRTREKASGT